MKKLTSVFLLAALLVSAMSIAAQAEDSAVDDAAAAVTEETTADTAVEPDEVDADAEESELIDMIVSPTTDYAVNSGLYSYDAIASELFSIDILRGDVVNFNLEDIPDRLQACVMVVRMRGEEAAALAAYEAGEITCPFTDVTEEWAKPYLAWLYEKKITLGIGDGKFGNGECTAQMYVTFMLRALGYVDVATDEVPETDFLFDTALEFAQEKALWDELLANEPGFSRGVMAAVTYQTLAADIKGSENNLLTGLVASGAIDAEAAQPMLDKLTAVDTIAALESASLPTAEEAKKVRAAMTMDTYYYTAMPEQQTEDVVYMSIDYDIAYDLTGENAAVAMTSDVYMELSGMKVTMPTGFWLKEGVVYVDSMGEKSKSSDGALNEIFTSLYMDPGLSESVDPYYAISAAEVITEEDGSMTIVCDTTDFMWPTLLAAMGELEFNIETADMNASVVTEYYLDANGVLTGSYVCMYFGAYDGEGADAVLQEYIVELSITDMIWGDDVVLEFPDFSDFVEITADDPEVLE